jgi:surfactin synthase thioesterase subunit
MAFILPETGNSVRALASLYVNEITRIQPTGPYRLGGFCDGGAIAFEIAQQLRSRAGCRYTDTGRDWTGSAVALTQVD